MPTTIKSLIIIHIENFAEKKNQFHKKALQEIP